MKDFIKSTRFKILAGLLTVLLGFMVMAVYTGGAAPLFSQLAGIVTVPLQKLSSNISYSVSGFFEQFMNAKKLNEENEAMRAEINNLRRNMADYEKIKHENEQFRQIIGVEENRQELSLETASVIARESTGRSYSHSFTIDKGTLNGVSLYDPVMTADGLVGYVYETGVTYSKVITILDVTVDAGVYDSSTRDIGIVSGTVELASQGLCLMEYLPRDSLVAKGHIIMTNGSSLFPKDILVGTVEEVRPNSHGTSTAAVIKPAADIASVKDVFVITHFEGQGEK